VSEVETFELDGQRGRVLRVFCASRGHSVDPSACAACSFGSVVSRETVDCCWPGAEPQADPRAPLYIGADASALHTPVGAVCAAHVLAVRAKTPAAELRGALQGQPYVVVVGADDHVLGVVTDGLSQRQVAGGTAEGTAPTVREAEPLRNAIERMIHGRRRFLPVVDDAGRFVGAVTDLDVLRWVKRRHG